MLATLHNILVGHTTAGSPPAFPTVSTNSPLDMATLPAH